jgi:protein TonB
VLLSLCFHAALVALVLAAGSYKFTTTPRILEVSLVAPGQAAGGDAAPAAVQPAEKPAPVPRPVTRAKKPVSLPRPKPRQQIAPEPPPQVQAPIKTAPPQKVNAPAPGFTAPSAKSSGAASAGSALGMSSAGAGAARGLGQGEGQGRGGQGHPGSGLAAAQTQYLGLVRARILAHRRYPPLAKARHLEGVVRLRFTLSNTGALSQGVQIVKASGFDVLDEQASQCVLAAAPFPPFPPELRKNSLTVEVPIVYQLKDLAG